MKNKTKVIPGQRKNLQSSGLVPSGLLNEEGSALIELAVGLTICTTLILGAAEFGRLAYAGIEVSNAARAGAQYGSQSRTLAADLTNITTAATQDAPDVSGISATASYFCQCSNGGASTCAVTDCSTSRIVEYVQVNTSAAVSPGIYVPGLPRSYTLTGKAVMRVVQ
jgi:Flp pilus assembly protein TadG